jgi:predicted SAM-dependent methyltransferase
MPGDIKMGLDFTSTSIRIDRPLSSYEKIRALVGWVTRGRLTFAKLPDDGEYIEVGCGPNIRDDFYCIDYSWRPGIELCWDITKGLPIPSNLVGGIFSEHCLEHISFVECLAVTKEFHRIMRNGAAIRIVVPDGELYARKYLAGEPMPYAAGYSLNGIYSPFMSVNQIFYSHGHRFIYDFLTMAKVLEQAGFREIEKHCFEKAVTHVFLSMMRSERSNRYTSLH